MRETNLVFLHVDLMWQSINLLWKTAARNVGWAFAYFCGDIKIIFAYNLVAPLNKNVSKLKEFLSELKDKVGVIAITSMVY